jgi:hypothetical protein
LDKLELKFESIKKSGIGKIINKLKSETNDELIKESCKNLREKWSKLVITKSSPEKKLIENENSGLFSTM